MRSGRTANGILVRPQTESGETTNRVLVDRKPNPVRLRMESWSDYKRSAVGPGTGSWPKFGDQPLVPPG